MPDGCQALSSERTHCAWKAHLPFLDIWGPGGQDSLTRLPRSRADRDRESRCLRTAVFAWQSFAVVTATLGLGGPSDLRVPTCFPGNRGPRPCRAIQAPQAQGKLVLWCCLNFKILWLGSLVFLCVYVTEVLSWLRPLLQPLSHFSFIYSWVIFNGFCISSPSIAIKVITGRQRKPEWCSVLVLEFKSNQINEDFFNVRNL